MESNLFTSLGRGSCTQFAKQAEVCLTYTTLSPRMLKATVLYCKDKNNNRY